MWRSSLLALGLLAALPGCGRPADGGNVAGRAAADTALARRDIERTIRAYAAASNAGDVDSLVSLYADDAVVLPPDHGPVAGRQAIADFWREGLEPGMELTPVRITVAGDLAYAVGRYVLPPTAADPADSGKMVFCLRRQPDGRWRVTADIWNTSTAPEGEDGEEGPRAFRT